MGRVCKQEHQKDKGKVTQKWREKSYGETCSYIHLRVRKTNYRSIESSSSSMNCTVFHIHVCVIVSIDNICDDHVECDFFYESSM